ncbi:MAG: ABC transporter ATP-binding protein [Dehalococcoidales bacterium]|nr:ABC transporter ATP-binding protein [Dehalococcoidales bacterium]
MDNLKKAVKIIKSVALSSILTWSKPVRWSIVGVSIISVVSALISLGLTLVTKALVDSATGGNVDALWHFGILMVGLYAVQRGLSVWMSFMQIRTSAKLQQHLQGMVTRAILGKEYGSLKQYHSGELVNRVFSDVSVVKSGIMNLFPTLLQTVISFIGAAIILISWDWRFVPVMIVAALIGSGVMVAFREPMKRRHKRMQAAEDALHASTQETLENIRLVKASAGEERAIGHLDDDRDHLVSEQVRNGKLSIAFNSGMGVVFDISRLICYLWGCIKIYQHTFTYGSLAAMLSLVGRIQAPIANGMRLVSQAYGVVASAERLMEVIGLPDEKQGESISSFDSIEMKNVCFQYDDGIEDVLLNISATIRRGDFVALTGISGGGKTSLFQLLLGIYRPTSGSVQFVDGDKVINACRGTRGLFAYVPQGNTLLSGTLRDNLTMFTSGASEEAIVAAIHAACLDDVVAEVGLDVKLGERGIGLSEGQAQRVAIARALLSDAQILLLDEATSALDEQTEAKLLSNIDAMRDKTVIIVTHRRAALAICDYTLHIENGRMTRIEGTNV